MPFELFLGEDGKPIVTDKGVTYHDPATGNKAIYNVNELMDSIREKNGEAASHRKEKEAAMKELATLQQTFEGVDPEKARKALETVSSLDAGKLLEAGKVDEIKRQIALDNEQKFNQLSKSLETTKAEAQAQLAEKEQVIEGLLIGSGIAVNIFGKAKKVSSDLLRKFGVKATFQRVAQGKFNPATGRIEGGTTLEWQAYAVKGNISITTMTDTRIKSGDAMITVDVEGGNCPQEGDIVVFGVERWVIVTAMPIEPGAELIIFKGAMRRQ